MPRRFLCLSCCILLTTIAAGCAARTPTGSGVPALSVKPRMSSLTPTTMRITSPAFGHNQPIPPKYTCDGQDIIPPLDFGDIPTGTKSLVLILDDPDAPSGVWDHWIVFDMPGDTQGVAEGQEPAGTHGKNSANTLTYGGPCPPNGQHRYFFKLYALDTLLGLKAGAKKTEVEAAMQGHILDQAELIGLYSR
jgi:Raf kinase inhibitor-like YbhB/YbcL family protein